MPFYVSEMTMSVLLHDHTNSVSFVFKNNVLDIHLDYLQIVNHIIESIYQPLYSLIYLWHPLMCSIHTMYYGIANTFFWGGVGLGVLVGG